MSNRLPYHRLLRGLFVRSSRTHKNHRHYPTILIGSAFVLLAAGCRINDPLVNGVPTEIISPPTAIPTDTLAPIVSMTPRYTATLIPSPTAMPTNPPPPTVTPTSAIPTNTPTATTIVVTRGTINFNNPSVNLRTGPGSDFETIRKVPAGTVVTIMGVNDQKSWYLLRLEDSTLGWVSGAFVSATDDSNLSIVTVADATLMAAQPAPETPAPTLPSRLPRANDILAYCDNPEYTADAGKSVSSASNVNIYWSWFAAKPEQIQDHLDYGTYTIKLNGRVLDNWRSYRTAVRRVRADKYEVYWYVPVGKLEAGEYTVDYLLTWSQKIEDGSSTFGPGGEQETNTGTCKFTVK